MNQFLFTFAIFIIYLHQSLYLAYFFQLKEYRFDRLFSGLKQYKFKIFAQMFDLFSWYRPRPTLRSFSTLLFLIIFFVLLGPISLFLSVIFILPLNIALTLLFQIPKQSIVNKATKKLSNSKGVIIGITGSFGKTFTKEVVWWLLSGKFKTVKTKSNNNTLIGIAKNILSWPVNFDYAVVEMAAYKRGEIKQICHMVKPDIGIITGLGDQHLDLFGSLENIKKAKYELINSLPPKSFHLVAGVDFAISTIQDLSVKQEHVSFSYKGTRFKVPIIGSFVVSNIISSILLCHHLGLSLKYISQRLSKLPTDLIYPKIKKTSQFTLINDTYNSSFESFKNLINYAKSWPKHKKILVSNGIIELGKNEQKDYSLLSSSLKIFDKIITTNPVFYQTIKSKNNLVFVKDSSHMQNYLEKIIDNPQPKVIFAKGRLYPQINKLLQIDD